MWNRIVWGEVTVSHLVIAAAVIFLAGILAKILTLYLQRLFKEKISKDHLQLLLKIISFVIYFIALLTAFSIIGLNLGSLLFAGTVAGIVLGFASQSIVSNFFAGVFLIIERPMKIGDQINIEDVTGFIEDIRILSTTIRTYDGLFVRIPNQTVFTNKMINYVGNIVRRFEYEVGIRYSDDADKAISIIKDVIEGYAFALKKPKPHVFVDSLGDNAVIIKVRVWAPVSEWFELKMLILWDIKKTLETHGIEIAFPQRTLWFANALKNPTRGAVSDKDMT